MPLKDKYINPLTDFGFKKLFGEEPNKALLIDFLNQILPQEHQIEQLSYTKNEHLGNNLYERKAIFDLYCESSRGEKFIVELQKAKQNYFKDRSVYYSTFPIQEQAEVGDWDFKLSAVYTIGILDFVFEETKNNPDILHRVQLKNQRNQVFFDKLTYLYIELPKFEKTEEELATKFDKWLYVFKHLSKLQDKPQALQEQVFEQLFQAAAIASFTREERAVYEDSLKYYRDIKNVVDSSKEEGWEQGITKGIAIGEDKKALQIAKRMKELNLPIATIAQSTGLSEDQIKEL